MARPFELVDLYAVFVQLGSGSDWSASFADRRSGRLIRRIPREAHNRTTCGAQVPSSRERSVVPARSGESDIGGRSSEGRAKPCRLIISSGRWMISDGSRVPILLRESEEVRSTSNSWIPTGKAGATRSRSTEYRPPLGGDEDHTQAAIASDSGLRQAASEGTTAALESAVGRYEGVAGGMAADWRSFRPVDDASVDGESVLQTK